MDSARRARYSGRKVRAVALVMAAVAVGATGCSDSDDQGSAETAAPTTATTTPTSAAASTTSTATTVTTPPPSSTSTTVVDATQLDAASMAAAVQPVAAAYDDVWLRLTADPAGAVANPNYPVWSDLASVTTESFRKRVLAQVQGLSAQGKHIVLKTAGRTVVTGATAVGSGEILADVCGYNDAVIVTEAAGTTTVSNSPNSPGVISGVMRFEQEGGRWLVDKLDANYFDPGRPPESCTDQGLA